MTVFSVTAPEVALDRERLTDVCKLGEGSTCCRYVVMAAGWVCAKNTELRPTIEGRIADGSMTAQGDNCAGLPLEDAK